MASLKGRILSLFGGSFLNKATVAGVERLGDRFVLLHLAGDPFAGGAPGDKVQCLLPSQDVRTLTPFVGPEGPALLIHRQVGRPLGDWAGQVAAGDSFLFAGPSKSLRLPAGPTAILGDHTAIALGAAYAGARGAAVILGEGEVSLGPVLERLGLAATVRPEADVAGLVAAVPAEAALGTAGGTAFLAAVRAALAAQGRTAAATRPYWMPGRAGLD